MIVHYVTVSLLVGFALPASCVAHNTMTKNLKVLVSSNDFPASGLKVLEEQWVLLIFLHKIHVILSAICIAYREIIYLSTQLVISRKLLAKDAERVYIE